MQFFDNSNRQGICQEIDRLCDSNDTSYPRIDKTSRVNNFLEEVISWIINTDGTWQFDDTNHTDAPRGRADLVEAQEYYTYASDFLQLEEVDILDTNNVYQRIRPLDNSMLRGLSPQEYFGVDSSGNPNLGFPRYYDKKGDSFRLYPAPTSTQVTLTNGYRIWFKRTASLFTVTTGTGADTDVPGFVSTQHVILAYMAAIPFCISFKPERVARYRKVVEDMKKEIIKHYSHREKDERKIMTMAGAYNHAYGGYYNDGYY